MFVRILKKGLEEGFKKNGGLKGRKELIRRLLGSPALVKSLEGTERWVAVKAYTGAIRGLFVAGAVLALGMVVMQAGTGWKKGVEPGKLVVEGEESLVGNGRGIEDEEWEEEMERAV